MRTILKTSVRGTPTPDGGGQRAGRRRHDGENVARLVAVALVALVVVSGCGSSDLPARSSGIPRALVLQARPIGRGARFHLPATGPVIGGCRRRLGPRIGVHVELFAANRVVLVAAGIGTRPPWTFSVGRISGARCYGELVTLEPTGLVLVRPGARLTLSDLFRGWGEPLSRLRLAGFSAATGTQVAVFVDGRRWHGSPASVPLGMHSEIVLEVGPPVPPHTSYMFPPGA
jgi:hypothetical protein